jgi:hypothetical protein
MPVETIPGMGEEGMKENGGGVNSCMIYLTDCKNFSKCHNVPSTQQNKKRWHSGCKIRAAILIALNVFAPLAY